MKLRNKKTGEIFELDKLPKWLKETIQLTATFYSRECEVYEPKEPLIKDPKIRKALRDWYELFDTSQLGEFKDGKYIAVGYREFILQSYDKSLSYTFELPFIDGKPSLTVEFGLSSKEYYTLAELCGEEEECEN